MSEFVRAGKKIITNNRLQTHSPKTGHEAEEEEHGEFLHKGWTQARKCVHHEGDYEHIAAPIDVPEATPHIPTNHHA